MGTYVLLILLELLVIFLISRRLIQSIFFIIFRFSGSQKVGIIFVSLILYPGTIIHELSHLFTASILGVTTGNINLTPEIPKIEPGKYNYDIRTGSVQIAQTDPLRRYLIGLSPINAGLTVISALSYLAIPLYSNLISQYTAYGLVNWKLLSLTFLLIYLIFSVSNSMFSSPKDLEGFGAFTIFIILILIAGYLAGFKINMFGQIEAYILKGLNYLVISLSAVLILNIILLSLNKILIHFIKNSHL